VKLEARVQNFIGGRAKLLLSHVAGSAGASPSRVVGSAGTATRVLAINYALVPQQTGVLLKQM
jgi:hypothetical protein